MRTPRDPNRWSGSRIAGFTLAELLVVLAVISLLTLLAQLHLFGLLRTNTFRAQVQELVSTMQMAANSAASSDKRYEVIIDIPEQGYLLRQITNPDLSVVLDEEIVVQANLSSGCRLAYVEFDDRTYTNDGRAKFRTGHNGWAYGGKIVLLDERGQPYSIVINRLNRIVALEQGDVGLLEPRLKNELLF